jgi:hypothetical protein
MPLAESQAYSDVKLAAPPPHTLRSIDLSPWHRPAGHGSDYHGSNTEVTPTTLTAVAFASLRVPQACTL